MWVGLPILPQMFDVKLLYGFSCVDLVRDLSILKFHLSSVVTGAKMSLTIVSRWTESPLFISFRNDLYVHIFYVWTLVHMQSTHYSRQSSLQGPVLIILAIWKLGNEICWWNGDGFWNKYVQELTLLWLRSWKIRFSSRNLSDIVMMGWGRGITHDHICCTLK